MRGRRLVLLDRDGTINEEVGHLCRMEDLVLIPGAGEGIRLLNRSGFKVAVVTNQSGVARGFFDEAFMDEVHGEIERRIAGEGGRLDGWYVCPHHPTQGNTPYTGPCRCRKPAPGLLERACRELGVEPAQSIVVGDSRRDMELAWGTGARAVLVRTGFGEATLSALPAGDLRRLACVAGDLLAACRWICVSS